MGGPTTIQRVRALAAVALVAAVAAAPEASATPAGPDQEPTPEEQQAEVRRRKGEVDIQIDLLEAQNTEVETALATIETNVTTQQAELDAATTAKADADAALVAADEAVAQAETAVAQLNLASDALVINAYVAPPGESAWDVLTADSLADAAIMQTVLDLQSESDESVLEMLEVARDNLETERDNQAVAVQTAEDTRLAEETELSEAQAARDQQVAFQAEVDAALDHALIEAANLETVDAELSREIAEAQAERARQAEAARQAAEAANAPPPPSGGVVQGPNGLASVSCYTGGAITVADTLAPSLQRLLDAAHADGLNLCGGGYRDPEAQIRLRREHCGTSYYDIYQKPASQCSPPTARPGMSMHEQGLAVDFANCSTRSTACYRWLAGNASDFGLYNLPSEAWHWSVNGN